MASGRTLVFKKNFITAARHESGRKSKTRKLSDLFEVSLFRQNGVPMVYAEDDAEFTELMEKTKGNVPSFYFSQKYAASKNEINHTFYTMDSLEEDLALDTYSKAPILSLSVSLSWSYNHHIVDFFHDDRSEAAYLCLRGTLLPAKRIVKKAVNVIQNNLISDLAVKNNDDYLYSCKKNNY